jgi:hypothetical protein
MCSYISHRIRELLSPLLVFTTHPTEQGSDLTVNRIFIQSDSDLHHDSGRCSREAISRRAALRKDSYGRIVPMCHPSKHRLSSKDMSGIVTGLSTRPTNFAYFTRRRAFGASIGIVCQRHHGRPHLLLSFSGTERQERRIFHAELSFERSLRIWAPGTQADMWLCGLLHCIARSLC